MLRTVSHSSRARDRFQRLKKEDGASLFEYAIIFMFFLALLLGIFNFGYTLYAYHFVSNAAREATRYALVRGSTCNGDANPNSNPVDPGSCPASNSASGVAGPTTATDIQQFVTNITPAGLDPTKVTVNPNNLNFWPSTQGTCATTSNAPGCTVQVQVSYTFNFIFPFVNNSPLTLTSTSQMVIAH
jgi:Flp pilus assembly protein TadG